MNIFPLQKFNKTINVWRGSEKKLVRINTACIEEFQWLSVPQYWGNSGGRAFSYGALRPCTCGSKLWSPKIVGASVMLLQRYNNTPMNTIYESLQCAQDLVLRPPEFLSYFLSIVSVYYMYIRET